MPTAYITFDLYNMDFEAARPISTGNGLHNTQQFGGRQQTTEKLNRSHFYIYNKLPIRDLSLVPLLSLSLSLAPFMPLLSDPLKALSKSLAAQRFLMSPTASNSQSSSRQ